MSELSWAGWMWWVAGLAGAAVLVWPGVAAPTMRIGPRSLGAGARSGRAAPRSRLARLVGSGGPAGPGQVGRLSRLGRLRDRPGGPSGPGFDREVLSLLEGLAGALRAGLTPARAFVHLAATADLTLTADLATTDLERAVSPGRRAEDREDLRSLPALLSRLAAQATSGAPLEPTWRAGANAARSPVLLAVAEGWALSERHGAPVADVLDALVVALRDGLRTDAAVETALAAPRATAALLGVLPLGGVALGELVGVHPLAVLVGSPAGRVVGVAGLVATVAGRRWMRGLVRAVGA